MEYIVITENDVSNWQDETGFCYHFPNRYLKFLKPGNKLLYYKGKLKDKAYAKDRLSSNPYYFGVATVGNISPDQENPKNSFCEILDYRKFKQPVNIKNTKNQYYELIPASRKFNHWRDGVRETTELIFNEIIKYGN